MIELLEEAREELKRVDHQIYVSLKYTRTVDVLKLILQRLVSAFEIGVDILLTAQKKKGIIDSIPTSHKAKGDLLIDLAKSDTQMKEYIDFYMNIRRITRATYECKEEYRRHVTMIVKLDCNIEITMDTVKKDYEKTKLFINYIENIITDKDPNAPPQ